MAKLTLSMRNSRLKPGNSAHPWRAGGFTLLELMVVLLALSAVAYALVSRTQSVSNRQQALDTAHQLAVADAQVRQFAAANGRLPCPDTGVDGVEDCGAGAAKGFLPYKTLGLASTQYVFGEVPLRYGVYRNSGATADLAINQIRFNPTDSDGTAYPTATADVLDFCTGLKNAAAAAPSTSYTYLGRPDGSTSNVAFALAYAGNTDSDGINGLYDGLNGAAGAGLNSPGTTMTAAYDDATSSRGFNEMYNMLRCDITQRSLDLAANAVAIETDVISLAAANSVQADQGVIMNAIGTAITAWGMLQGIAAVAAASEVLTVSSGLLATAVATCIVLVGCAFIPVYTTAVTFATAGLIASIAAAVLSGVALGLQITATVLYVGIQGAAGPPPGGSSTPFVTTPATQTEINTAWNDYVPKKTAADAAQLAYTNGLAAATATAATAAAAKTAMDAAIALSPSAVTNLNPLIYGAGTKTVTNSTTAAAPTTATVNSTCLTVSPYTCAPNIPYATSTSTAPVYTGACITGGMTAADALKTAGCTTNASYSTTTTTVATTYATGSASTVVTTTVTNVVDTTALSASYVKGALASTAQYESQNANYVVNGGVAPDATEMNAAILAAHNQAGIEQTNNGCVGCVAAVDAYLAAYQAEQLAYYQITDTPASGSTPAIPSPLLLKRDNTAATAEAALDHYNTLVCSTGSTLVGAGPPPGSTPGGTGTGYSSSSNLCVSASGAGTPGSPTATASGAQNILDLLRSLGSVK